MLHGIIDDAKPPTTISSSAAKACSNADGNDVALDVSALNDIAEDRKNTWKYSKKPIANPK
jgi:hypothetical protein